MAESYHTVPRIGILWFGGLSSGAGDSHKNCRGLSSKAGDRSQELLKAIILNQSLGIAFSVGKVGAYCIHPTYP